MEYKSISAKMPRNETTLVESYCKKKGITSSSLIRDLLLREIKVTIPNNKSGKNLISYNKSKDNFSWSIELDDGSKVEILRDVSAEYIEDLKDELSKATTERMMSLDKKKTKSVPVPSNILRGKK